MNTKKVMTPAEGVGAIPRIDGSHWMVRVFAGEGKSTEGNYFYNVLNDPDVFYKMFRVLRKYQVYGFVVETFNWNVSYDHDNGRFCTTLEINMLEEEGENTTSKEGTLDFIKSLASVLGQDLPPHFLDEWK